MPGEWNLARFAAALPNFLIYEYMQSDWSKNQPNPLRHKLLRQPAEVYEDGYMLVDDRPGIGVELDEEATWRWHGTIGNIEFDRDEAWRGVRT